jgi:folate-dependent phosphoribosylglycinamide formyltransferase PurN
MRFVLTAGFDRALHAIALAELVTRDAHEIACVLVVDPFRIARLRAWLRRNGGKALVRAARRLLSRSPAGSSDARMLEFLAKNAIPQRSLRAWAHDRGVAYHVIDDLNSERAIELARQAQAQAALYAGGGILRDRFLASVGGPVLNAHSGPLPRIRGMNACEWSLLLGEHAGVTIHVIDSGIDTGGVIATLPLEVKASETLETLRGQCAELGVIGMRQAIDAIRAPLPARASDAAASRQCFTMAPVLRELLEVELSRGKFNQTAESH